MACDRYIARCAAIGVKERGKRCRFAPRAFEISVRIAWHKKSPCPRDVREHGQVKI